MSAGASLGEARHIGGEPSWTTWGREQVGCWWLSAITLHSVIMPPPAAASNLNSSLDFFLRAGGRTQPKNNLEHAGHSSGQKYLLGWFVCRTGG